MILLYSIRVTMCMYLSVNFQPYIEKRKEGTDEEKYLPLTTLKQLVKS